MLERYRLANLACTVPMPDRGGRLFSQGPQGEMIDVEHPFYRTMIADGDVVLVASRAARLASRDASEASPPVAPAGRRNSAGLQSEPRPSAEDKNGKTSNQSD